MTPNRVLLTAAVAGAAGAVLLPLDRPGLGWVLTALVVFGLLRRVAPGWAALSTALFAVGAFLAAEWLFALCAVAGCAAGSLAVAGGRTARGLVLGSAAVPVASFRALPWLARGLRGGGVPAAARPVLVTVALLLVFVPLLAGADESFADLLGTLTPEADGQALVVFPLVALGVLGACHLLAVPVDLDGTARPARRVARRDWALPVGALVALFAAFAGVQLTTLFAGDAHVVTTDGLTYSGYARTGFWQLLAVTVLTLGVIAPVARFARLDTDRDRTWLRGLLGALAVLTLVIVASALTRMWLYQQAYGFTVPRLLVLACELWLGVVYLLVIAAGVELDGAWLARAVVATGFGALLVLAALDPDRFVAERNVERWQRSGTIDLPYLSTLSDDAVPAILTLPDHLRDCAFAMRGPFTADDWRTWNLGREIARRRTAEAGLTACGP
ncbi:DUF4153 domain-containing protein [Saccharothrix yanglingensis]|uniref:DUF4173 domain-containing protein n=1 Tax=Saccharothrix yanglingensis TaxID=659496 RepID=A0ABU0X4D5_9PSEU|nr:DUF4173 domain-containing protein [Saccharothrix yanglingensis]MDQ2586981.1 hypothetical protein [Saccharothrix yanglingensis]